MPGNINFGPTEDELFVCRYFIFYFNTILCNFLKVNKPNFYYH